MTMSTAGTVRVVVLVEETARDVTLFERLSRSLKQRFGVKVLLAFKEPELLFLNKQMLRCVSAGLVERVLVTDEGPNMWPDVIDYVKRLDCQRVFFCSYRDLVGQDLGFLRFLVATWFVHGDIEQSICGRYLAVTKARVDQLAAPSIAELDNLYWALVDEGAVPTKPASGRKVGRASLYVTSQGLERIGGADALKASPLQIGNISASQFKKIWLVDNALSLNDFLALDQETLRTSETIRIPGFLANGGSTCLLVDINPSVALRSAPTEENSLLAVPRQVLSISATTHSPSVSVSEEAVFVMSNFNKERYIAGALYSVLMQTHPRSSIAFVDDVSTDRSAEVVQRFKALVDPKRFKISLAVNEKSRGTYWIRNSIIHKLISTNNRYLINDSDDFSSSQRAVVQLGALADGSGPSILNLGDIVRVDKQCGVLLLDGKGERYGSATLCGPVAAHRELGYYENIRKNGDTEFVERAKRFKGKRSIDWVRYPVLFQTFDGNNLTADIYTLSEQTTTITSDLGQRKRHRELFEQEFAALTGGLAGRYTFPHYVHPKRYVEELSEFMIDS